MQVRLVTKWKRQHNCRTLRLLNTTTEIPEAQWVASCLATATTTVHSFQNGGIVDLDNRSFQNGSHLIESFATKTELPLQNGDVVDLDKCSLNSEFVIQIKSCINTTFMFS